MHGKVLVANPNVVTQGMDDGAVLMDMTSGECFELNRIGAEVWRRLGNGESTSELIEQIAASYGVPTSVVQSDVDQLLDRLTRSGLLTSTNP
jgi:hypothetical protein